MVKILSNLNRVDKMKTTLMTTMFLLASNVYADTFVAEAIKVRGEATQLSPGARSARVVEIGDKFSEDTSILTGAKSFIKIKFKDNTEINLGPESKIVISEMKSSSPGVISLLKGKIRTEVEKNKSAESANKFFIKTRTAAMGVRGTEFQTIYNPENRVTSLLTYKGEVAMAKIDETTYRKLEDLDSNIEVVRKENTNEVEIKKIDSSLDSSKELNKILAKNEAVLVPPGQNAMASDGLKKATLPVKINPVQLNALYKNEEFLEKDSGNYNPINTNDTKTIKPILNTAPQIAPLEGVNNLVTGDFAPKAGGLIDLKTGLYVAPDISAKLNNELGVYVSEKNGKLDQETGEYVAPSGIKLDATKGFVLESKSEDPKVLALKDDLNKSIARDLVIVGKLEQDNKPLFDINEKFIREELAISFMPKTQSLQVNPNQTNTNFFDLKADKTTYNLNVDWKMSSAKRFRFLLGGAIKNHSFSNSMPTNMSQESGKMVDLYSGAMYSLSRMFDLYSTLGVYQDHYLNKNSSNQYTLKRVALTKLRLGFSSQFFEDSILPINFDMYVSGNFRKKLNTLKIKEGTGVGLKLGTHYKLSEYRQIGLGLFSDSHHNRVVGDVGENRLERNDSGLYFNYLLKF
jgi:hypothetical protein